MKQWNIAILGATGAVGQEMLKVLAERKFPVGELKALASASSAGKIVKFGDKDIVVEETTEKSFDGMDFVLGAVSSSMSKKFAPMITKAGAVFIDNSSAFRLSDDVPLVIPQINPNDAFKHNGIIANPNCSTIVTLMAISGIARLTEIESMVACTYQAVSGAGREGIDELEAQIQAEVAGTPKKTKIFPCQILSNAIPCIGGPLENGYTEEEMKMQNEGRKILHLPELNVCCTCVRIPVMRSHSISVQLKLKDAVSLEAINEAIAKAPGCVLVDDIDGRNYPTPLDTTDQDLVYVGRVRRDLLNGDNGVTLWCCGDQIRKGAATNCIEIAELLVAGEAEEEIEEEPDIIVFKDENDNEITMEVLEYFFYEGEEYATLTEYKPDKCEGCEGGNCDACVEDVDVTVMKIVPVGTEDEEFLPVDDALAQKLLDLLNSGAFTADDDED